MPEENVIQRTMPNSLEAEQSVVGAMIIDKDAIQIASEIITGDDFYNRQLGMLFEAMVELHKEGTPVDGITLQNHLKEKNAPPQVYDMNYILGMAEAVPTSANVKFYAEIVHEKSKLRELIHSCGDIINNCYNDNMDLQDLMTDTEKEIFRITQLRNSGEFVPISEVVMNALNKIEQASKMQGTVTGPSTGFTDLDYRTAGFQPSDLILIAARPSMGKTAFALNIAQNVAIRNKTCMAIFSLEMSKEQLVNRMFSLQSGVDAQKLRTGNLTDSEWEELVDGAGQIGESKLIIDDTPGITVSELRSKCRKYKLEHGLSLVMIDYLQLMSGSGRTESRQQEISDISRSLKGLARELNIPIIALSQLSRAVEQRPDKRPILSDLRESGAIEQDADVVMFIYREDYYFKDTERKGISEIIIAKQRNGPIGTVELAWLPELTKFANLARDNKRE